MSVIGLSYFLRTDAPDFCWCSAYDLLFMVEQVEHLEEVSYNSFMVTLSRLKKAGVFITKEDPFMGVKEKSVGSRRRLYLRVTP